MVAQIARGFADAMAYVLDDDDVPGTGIDIPGPRTLGLSPSSDSEAWEGGDRVLTTVFNAVQGSATLALGMASPTALAAIQGTTAVVSGVAPDEITTMDQSSQPADAFLMLKAQARGRDVAGTAYRLTFPKAKAGPIQESLGINAFNEPSMDLTFMENSDELMIRREWFSTYAALPSTIAP